MKKIVLAGGTGFIGKFLEERFIREGYEVLIISRNKAHIQWDDENGLIAALNGADILINLAGKSVNCRYNKKNKEAILVSRTGTTNKLGNAVLKCSTPPLLWINSATATIYRHAEDRPMTEDGGEIGKGFSVEVAKAWEKSFFDFVLPKTRQVAVRMAIVLGKAGGVIIPMVRLTKFGLGGRQGKGTQMFSWIHIEDVFRIIQFIAEKKETTGIYNCSAPNPVTNKELMKELRKTLNIPIGLPAPVWLLKKGAVIIKTETELILKSRWVIPQRLKEDGYTFKFPFLEQALNDILKK